MYIVDVCLCAFPLYPWVPALIIRHRPYLAIYHLTPRSCKRPSVNFVGPFYDLLYHLRYIWRSTSRTLTFSHDLNQQWRCQMNWSQLTGNSFVFTNSHKNTKIPNTNMKHQWVLRATQLACITYVRFASILAIEKLLCIQNHRSGTLATVSLNFLS